MLVLGGAAILGVLIGARFGATPQTEAFTANALYGVTLFLAQSLRTTAASRLLGDERPFPRLTAHLDALSVLVVASALLAVLAVLGVGALGVEPEARDAFPHGDPRARAGVRVQLFAGLGSAALATRDDFMTPALAFGAGAAANVIGFLVLTPALGLDGVPLALAGGSLVAAAVVARALLRIGWRPRVPRPDVRAALVAWRLSLGAGAAVAAQIVLSVTVAASAAIIAGGATIFSYASMIIMVLTAALASRWPWCSRRSWHASGTGSRRRSCRSRSAPTGPARCCWSPRLRRSCCSGSNPPSSSSPRWSPTTSSRCSSSSWCSSRACSGRCWPRSR